MTTKVSESQYNFAQIAYGLQIKMKDMGPDTIVARQKIVIT